MFIMWLHLVAAITWIGGMLFLWLVLRPVLSGVEGQETLRRVEERFKTVRWIGLLTLLATGIYNLIHEGGSARLESSWGGILMIKLFLVAVVMGLSGVNDFLGSASEGRQKDLINGLILALALLIVLIAIYLGGA
jgi:putative copper export protein